MENFKLILPEHLNHYGFLYGGNLLKWADEYGYIAAKMDYLDCDFVTVGMNRVEFKKRIRKGEILRFQIKRVLEGETSVKYLVEVFRATSGEKLADPLFTTEIAYVSVDSKGRKRPFSEKGSSGS